MNKRVAIGATITILILTLIVFSIGVNMESYIYGEEIEYTKYGVDINYCGYYCFIIPYNDIFGDYRMTQHINGYYYRIIATKTGKLDSYGSDEYQIIEYVKQDNENIWVQNYVVPNIFRVIVTDNSVIVVPLNNIEKLYRYIIRDELIINLPKPNGVIDYINNWIKTSTQRLANTYNVMKLFLTQIDKNVLMRWSYD